MRQRDTGNRGTLSKDEVYDIVKDLHATKKQSNERRNWAIVMAASVLLLAVSNIGTAYLAVKLHKDTEVSSEGVLLTTSGNGVAAQAQGLAFVFALPTGEDDEDEAETTSDGSSFTCVSERELAQIYHGVTAGTQVQFTMEQEEQSNSFGISTAHSVSNKTHVCFTLLEDTSQEVCALLDENSLCNRDGGNGVGDRARRQRFLSNVHQLRSGRQLLDEAPENDQVPLSLPAAVSPFSQEKLTVKRGEKLMCQGFFRSSPSNMEAKIRWDIDEETICADDFCKCDFRTPDDLNFDFLTYKDGDLASCVSGIVRYSDTLKRKEFSPVPEGTDTCPGKACFCLVDHPIKLIQVEMKQTEGQATAETLPFYATDDFPKAHRIALYQASRSWIKRINKLPQLRSDQNVKASIDYLKRWYVCSHEKATYTIPDYLRSTPPGQEPSDDDTYQRNRLHILYGENYHQGASAYIVNCDSAKVKGLDGSTSPDRNFNVASWLMFDPLQREKYKKATIEAVRESFDLSRHEIGHALGLTECAPDFRQARADISPPEAHWIGPEGILGLEEIKRTFKVAAASTPPGFKNSRDDSSFLDDPYLQLSAEANGNPGAHFPSNYYGREVMGAGWPNLLEAVSLSVLRDCGWDMNVDLAELFTPESSGLIPPMQEWENQNQDVGVGEACEYNGNCNKPLFCSQVTKLCEMPAGGYVKEKVRKVFSGEPVMDKTFTECSEECHLDYEGCGGFSYNQRLSLCVFAVGRDYSQITKTKDKEYTSYFKQDLGGLQ